VGAGTEGLAEGPLLGDERTLTECNATSQFEGKTDVPREPGHFRFCLRHADCIEECPLSGVTRKTFAHTEFFSV